MDLDGKFRELKERKEGAHMAHVYYGDPSEEFSLRLIRTLAASGADLIEFGIPFSDPIADGPTFQAACERALRGGITPFKCIEGIRRLRKEGFGTPIVVTTYFNIPYAMGFEKFLDEIKDAGAQAILVPDLPMEEAKPFLGLAKKMGLHLILQVAPTTSRERLKRILAEASGFVYLISIEGVTGSRLKDWRKGSTMELIRVVKAQSPIPIMVGFGILKREHAESMVSAGADGVIVGSAYARIYQKSLENPYRRIDEIARLAREIKLGCIDGYNKR
ncbi:MAG: tryptophan synthase subunit alpha [Candidatus Bathyarchaeia archaeon]